MNTQFENLLVEQDGPVLTVTIHRPKVLNALNAVTLRELDQVVRSVAEDDSVRGVILTGSGPKAFVAGADIGELLALKTREQEARKVSADGQDLLLRLERLGRPVIAAINGFALGGGLELALACTFRTASRNAKMGLPEVKLGIIPGYGGTQRLPRLVGMGRALEMILTGEVISAERAESIGLVNHLFEAEELQAGTRSILDQILARGPVAVRCALDAAYRGFDMPLEKGLELEASFFGELATTEDMAEGMAAFMEKRPAEFKGH